MEILEQLRLLFIVVMFFLSYQHVSSPALSLTSSEEDEEQQLQAEDGDEEEEIIQEDIVSEEEDFQEVDVIDNVEMAVEP